MEEYLMSILVKSIVDHKENFVVNVGASYDPTFDRFRNNEVLPFNEAFRIWEHDRFDLLSITCNNEHDKLKYFTTLNYNDIKIK